MSAADLSGSDQRACRISVTLSRWRLIAQISLSTRWAEPCASVSNSETTSLRPVASPRCPLSSLPARVLFSETYRSVSGLRGTRHMKPLRNTAFTQFRQAVAKGEPTMG